MHQIGKKVVYKRRRKSMEAPARKDGFQLIHGDSNDMSLIRDGEAALVLTDPPYFPRDVEELLFLRRKTQQKPEMIWNRLVEFAETIRNVFKEMTRVSGQTGIIAIETKDIRYGNYLLPLAALHERLAMDAGLWLRTKILIDPANRNPQHAPRFQTAPEVGSFRTFDCSQVLIFGAKDFITRTGRALETTLPPISELMDPRWRVAVAGKNRTHPHQSPPEMIRRLIMLFTTPGELVVDPFAGSAQTLRMASELGRRAIGYEIDEGQIKLVRSDAKQALT